MRPNSPGLRAAFRSLKRRPGKRRGRGESRSEASFSAMRCRVVIDCLVILDWFAFTKRVYLRWSVRGWIRLPDRHASSLAWVGASLLLKGVLMFCRSPLIP
jgi:hypothetical protein